MRMDEIKSKTQRITSSLTNTAMSGVALVGSSGPIVINNG